MCYYNKIPLTYLNVIPKHTQRSLLFKNDNTSVGPWCTFLVLMIILFYPFTLSLLYFIASVFMFYALRSFWLL